MENGPRCGFGVPEDLVFRERSHVCREIGNSDSEGDVFLNVDEPVRKRHLSILVELGFGLQNHGTRA